MKKKIHLRVISIFMIFLMIYEISFPTVAWALTGGPSQPEVQSFEPVGTSEMVDLFSGDFNYNIPLLDVEGYPVNISYHSGITMDQEASWVGLGWNINPGVVNRNMRGIPDDFNGDVVKKEMNLNSNQTCGISIGYGFQLYGFPGSIISASLQLGLGIFNNSYKGVGLEYSISPAMSIAALNKFKLNAGLGISGNSQSGLGINPSIGLSYSTQMKDEETKTGLGFTVSAPYNSRTGLKALCLNIKASVQYKNKNEEEDGFNDLGSQNASSTYNIGTQSYTPQLSNPMQNFNLSYSATIGDEVFGLHNNGTFRGYYSDQRLKSNYANKKAYGYLFSQNAIGNDDVMLDFNREKDGTFTDATPNLALTNSTFDIYGVSGQGIGGTYRPFRGDIGIIHDDKVLTTSASGSLGGEYGFGNLFHAGIDLNVNYSESESGLWEDAPSQVLDFYNNDYDSNPLYEPYYFKNVGEKTTVDQEFFDKIDNDNPIRMGLQKDINNSLNYTFVHKGSYDEAPDHKWINNASGYYRRKVRDKRNQAITMLNAQLASEYGLEQKINSYALNSKMGSSGLATPTGNNRSDANHTASSISEITALNPGGQRYVYGIPAMNLEQEEVTFNASKGNVLASTDRIKNGLVSYTTTSDAVTDAGNDGYYTKTTLPSYAHSYLLTAVLSADYVDLTGNGPTPDDLGTYTKINYTRVTDSYHWRVPVVRNKATYEQGLSSIYTDDKAHYIYGEKELWMVNSIETRNYIAEFDLGPRDDSYGVYDRDGGLDTTMRSKCLRQIALYSKQDKYIHGPQAVPIKVVHFEYDYSLCPGIENNKNGGGKLTLKKIYFSYGISEKGKVSPYSFTYSTFNPGYNLKGYDRWGNYKPNSGSPMWNSEYPYTNQSNRDTADKYSSAWTLNEIDLPSGGKINVNFEADDYAYVQDRPAMEMFTIKAFGNSNYYGTNNRLYEKDGNGTVNNYIFFPLKNTLSGTNQQAQIYDQYIKYLLDGNQVGDIFFNCHMDIINGQTEFVKGYAQLDFDNGTPYGVSSNDNTVGWIRVKSVRLGDEGDKSAFTNPISKAAWQLLRLQMPQLVYPDASSPNGPNTGIIRALAAMAMDIKVFLRGFNTHMHDKGYSRIMQNDSKSWIRLVSPNKKKVGGGSRVKQISVSDNWSAMGIMNTVHTDYDYGQQYSYTTTEARYAGTALETQVEISSGVASYEPMVGAEENPWHLPIKYTVDNHYAKDDELYLEMPFGETFFPSPGIGYSKVTVKNIARTNVKRTATGYTVSEFYTAKDYPTLVDYTNIGTKEIKPNPILKVLNIGNDHYKIASQGYVIELNDMHGKPKSTKVYAEGQSGDGFKSSIEYFYHTDQSYNAGDPNKPKKLSNNVLTVNPDNTLAYKNVGMDIDCSVDMREDQNHTWGGGLQCNLETFSIPPIFVIVPIILPSFSEEKTNFKSSVITKVVNRFGLLEKTVAKEDGAQITTSNIAYDSETGEVLLTSTQNEFEDPIYNFTYPAHWAYDGMGPAYKNIGARFDHVKNLRDSIILPNGLKPCDYFEPGDEIATNIIGTYSKLWVHKANHKLFFIDENGYLAFPTDPGSSFSIQIIRSGRRNMQTVPVGTITCLQNPIVSSGGSMYLSFGASTNIIHATAVEFSDQWDNMCDFGSRKYCDSIKTITNEILILANYLADSTTFQSGDSGHIENKAFYINSNALKPWIDSHVSGSGYVSFRVSVTNISSPIEKLISISIKKHSGSTDISIGQIQFVSKDTSINTNSIIEFFEPRADSTSLAQGFLFAKDSTGKEYFLQLVADGFPDFFKCYTTCIIPKGKVLNPYIRGFRGNWRKKRDRLYYDKRNYTTPTVSVRHDGTFTTFDPFWKYYTVPGWTVNPRSDLDYVWPWTSEVTKYSSQGIEIENKDALNRYSAAIYGYGSTLPIAVASNASHNQIGYDGFEDYLYLYNNACENRHWGFKNSTSSYAVLDTVVYHTGNRSLKVSAGHSASVTRTLYNCKTDTTTYHSDEYYVTPCNCIGLFSPDTGMKYVVSGWVKLDTVANAYTYPTPTIVVTQTGSTTINNTFFASGPIIEGWQRIEGVFNIPYGTTNITVQLSASPNSQTWFDDLRIFPFNGEMKTYCYDERTLKLLGEMDENNYATIYEYDDQGALIRVKKETIEGIMTLKENKNSTYKR